MTKLQFQLLNNACTYSANHELKTMTVVDLILKVAKNLKIPAIQRQEMSVLIDNVRKRKIIKWPNA